MKMRKGSKSHVNYNEDDEDDGDGDRDEGHYDKCLYVLELHSN